MAVVVAAEIAICDSTPWLNLKAHRAWHRHQAQAQIDVAVRACRFTDEVDTFAASPLLAPL